MIDLKAVIGCFFLLTGLILMLYQLYTDSTDLLPQVNFTTGLFYTVFGAILLLIWKLDKKKA
ncbi:hypothetical protein [Flavihumibacter sp. CACIAM 22H1]|uniref:hypothetical protein n=1 Tax=Flavihumibacter sp. CACIAM 22H1 TaxID=1812911 RepID=UPI0007A92D54|nr:hypothetical protein [Flavihumibacter sp. CACIAM 22H1]KYP14599.1 MAG: hypothetical protein A1D16_16035 [Flavihumibacter sp. CACIAM 22H1]